MPGDCGLVGHIAGTIVNQGWAQWSGYANGAIVETEELLASLGELDITPLPVSVDFSPPDNLGVPFEKPLAPDAPDLTFNYIEGPGNPAVSDVIIPTFAQAPADTLESPELSLPTAPLPFSGAEPGDAPAVTDVTVPDAPTLTVPDAPTLRELALPDAPTSTIPAFTATAPVIDFQAPDSAFSFAEELYTSNALETVTARTTEMIAGDQLALTTEIWRAIWERARAKESVASVTAARQARDEFAKLGFSMPGGLLDKRLKEITQGNQNAESTLTREQAIQEAQMTREDVQFAIGQVVNLEGALIAANSQLQARRLEAAKFSLEAAIQIFNARVSLFNTQMQAFATEAQVYKARIEAEQAIVELYKGQLEGQRIIGELNRQEVEIYTARLQGLMTHVELYKGQLAGVQAVVDVDKARIEAFRAEVEAYSERVQAKTAEFQAYSEQIKGELAKVQIYEVDAKAFATRMQAYQIGAETTISRSKIEIDNEDLRLRRFQSLIDKFKAELNAEVGRIQAGTAIYNGQAAMYSAELNAEQARVVADSRQFELALESGKTEAQLSLEQAKINIDQIQRILALQQDALKTEAQIRATLAAGALSAVSLTAGVHEGASNSTSCSTSYSY